jgi:hypothetical protein
VLARVEGEQPLLDDLNFSGGDPQPENPSNFVDQQFTASRPAIVCAAWATARKVPMRLFAIHQLVLLPAPYAQTSVIVYVQRQTRANQPSDGIASHRAPNSAP